MGCLCQDSKGGALLRSMPQILIVRSLSKERSTSASLVSVELEWVKKPHSPVGSVISCVTGSLGMVERGHSDSVAVPDVWEGCDDVVDGNDGLRSAEGALFVLSV